MLTDAQCRNAVCPPDKKRARFTDAGGLYLEVSPAGSKRWFWKTYFDGKEGRIAFGSYPVVSLTAARKARDAAKLQKSEGTDPVQARKLEKVKSTRNTGDTFKAIALEWHGKQAPQWSQSHAGRMLRQLERDLFPWIGERPIVQIHAMELLAALQKIEERGALETADRALMLARQVWDYWLPTAEVQQRNITEGLKARLTPYRGKNFAAILDPQRMGGLMRAIKGYKGGPIVRTALQLTPLLYQRPGNLRMMEWAELDLDRALWTIPSMKMKRTVQGKAQGDAHTVPLSILSALDAKIACNNRINAELEALARTQYDYWFVQFDFPDANGKPYKSSGGKMVYNATLKRDIPAGWKDKRLAQIANITMGQSPLGESLNESKDGVEFFQGATDFGWQFPTVRKYTTQPARMAKRGDILLSVRAPVGDMNIANMDCCIGRVLAALNSKDSFDGFLFYVMQYFKTIFDRRNSEGTTFGSITKDDLHSLPLAYPSTKLLMAYDKIVSARYNQMVFTRSMENQHLTQLRDWLLPMLMNGQVSVK